MYLKKKTTINIFRHHFSSAWSNIKNIPKGNNVIETITSFVARFGSLVLLFLLYPIGWLHIIWATFYNLQKDVYDKNKASQIPSDRFSYTFLWLLYWILSAPFVIILLPFWLVGKIIIWIGQNI